MNTDTVAAHARNAHSLGTQRTRPIEELDGVVDGAHDAISDKATRADMRILLEHGKPLRYGNDNTSGIRMRGFEPEAVTLDEQGVTEADLVVHDETSANGGLAFVLSKFAAPLPVPLGVFRAVESPAYETLNSWLAADTRKQKGQGTLEQLFNGGDTWTID